MKLSVLRPRRDPVSPEPSTTSPEVRPPWWREWIPSAKTLRDELRRNPGLKLVSLLLAIMLWGTINVTERDAERIVELPVSLRKLQQGLIVTNPPGKPVTITLRGPRTILDHVDEHTSRVSVDLSSIGPGDARIELNTDMVRPELPRRLKVVRMEPARVKLKIDRLIRRSLPVRADLAGTPALGFMVAESRVVPDQIEVSGPATKVDELKEIPTEPIDLRGMNENGERSVLLGWVGDFIGFAPDRVTVYFTFEQVMVSREFKRVPVRARRADGVTVRLAPAFVDLTVRGPQVILHNLKIPDDAVWVDATDLKPGTHKVSPRVDLPAGLEVVRWQPDALQAQVAEGGRALMGLNGGRHLFGTDGVRGVANVEPMTSETALRLGRALAHVSKRSPHRHKILIGKDTRLSGYMLEQAMASGICSMGVDVLLVGPLPTPGIAFLTRSLRADAGVVISASHNPFQDNGIKFFSKAGFKLPDEVEHEIERLVLSDSIDALRPTKTEVGKAFRIDDAVGRYNVFAKSCFPRQLTLDGLTVAVDCGNGAAYRVAPEVLEELGARVVPLGVTPDGENINQNCGALYPRSLQEAVRVSGANVGIALDGDADRAIFVDEHGEVVDGDEIMAMLAADLDRRGELKARTLVATVMSNLGLHMAMRDRGIRVTTTPVGDRYVVEEMLRSGYNLGGEQSGHIVFLDHNTTGDGLITCLAVLALMVDKDVSLSELRQVMRRFPQVLLNVPVGRKPPIETVPDLQAAVTRAERALGERGRVLVRYSGTESLIRVMIEGEDESGIREMAESIVGVARKVLGAPAR